VKPTRLSRALWWGGLVLFLVSFLVPDLATGPRARMFAGAYALGYASVALYGAFFPPQAGWTIRDIIGFVALTVSILSNLSMFVKLPRRWAWTGIVAPWCVLMFFPGGIGPVLRFVPLYVWALGIGMMHASRYAMTVVEPEDLAATQSSCAVAELNP
jgi:hypothetical protein